MTPRLFLNLAVIGHLELLRQQFGEVVLPPAVLEELKIDADYPSTSEIRQAIKDGWLRKTDLQNDQVSRALQRELDDGEAEAIALALELGIKTVLIDERDGRTTAKVMGLTPVGILAVLIEAKRTEAIKSLREILERLQREAGFYISERLINAILSEVGE